MVSSRALWVLWACGPALAFRGSPRVLPRLPGQKWHVAAAPVEASGGAAASAAVPLVEGLGVGVKADVAGRLPFYRSDVVDGLSVKSVSVVLYLFFACLAPAVAFGSLQGAVTGGQIGAVEYILSTAACGVVYALTAAQPLTIIGSTGPVLAFTTVLFKLAASLGVPFLPLYAWTGLWASLYLFLGALFSLSNGVKYLTRFTDEIFSSLISTIFVYEAAKDVIFGALLNPKMAASTAFATALSAATTYGVATYNAGLRGAKKLKRSLRSGLADFAPAIGILSGCLAGVWAGHRAGAPLATLAMPKVFGTTSGRPWLVNLMDLPPKYRALSALPAAMVAVLLFFDQNITVRIVNADQNKLKKPTGYHQDLLVVSLLAAACSATGLPWLVAATVRSINHVNANAVYEEQDAADDGDAALAFAGVKEQRVTALAIHATIGAALLFGRDVLAKTPQAALMGLFLYLGTSALKGNQMFARSTELLGAPFIDSNHLDDKLAASRPWAKLPKAKTRAFTAIQLACLAAMMTLKSSPAGVLFPIIIAGLGPLRWVMLKTKAFTQAEIDALDMD